MGLAYLDCAATTPMDPAVVAVVRRYMEEDFGNAGSRTHEYGSRAKQAVQRARDQIGAVVGANRDDVVLTSGATEANNLAILGLRNFGETSGRRHIICTAIEHKAVLEPVQALVEAGFEVSYLPIDESGRLNADDLVRVLRPDTLLVSVMHVNNETGMIQPIEDICALLSKHEAYFHVDASQGYGKEIGALKNPRIDLMSASAHKIYGPKGVGALISRRRRFDRAPLRPLMFGGGQERGLRPGTVPVPLVAGFGEAASQAMSEHRTRQKHILKLRGEALAAFSDLLPTYNGDSAQQLPHFLNVSFPNVDSEALMVALKDVAAVSNGSACTSTSYTGSYVLKAMGLAEQRVKGAIRLSWSHLTSTVPWADMVDRIRTLTSPADPVG